MSDTAIVVDDPTRNYGDRVVAVEPGGIEAIPLDERHGTPRQLLWTWTSPNMEFATIGVGILGPLAFGLSFWQSLWAIVLGSALGSATQGILSTWGPRSGLPQMVLSRSGFGFLGNILPAGINAVVAGAGWFAVNSVSGALALHALFNSVPKGVCLLIIVVLEVGIAFFGHNLVHAFERFAFPVLAIVFLVACVVVLSKTNASAPHSAIPGAWLVMFGATFGYAAGWNPYASDYTRYLAPDTPSKPVGLYAFLGVFASCVLLEVAGAAAFTAGGGKAVAPDTFTSLLPTWLGKLTLLAIALGAISANAINMYSGSVSVMAAGLRLPTHAARAALALVLGAAGTVVAFFALDDTAGNYENFLLIIAYWVGPWLGVVLVDRWLRRGTDSQLIYGERRYQNWAGFVAMLGGGVISIWLFSNQVKYVGPLPEAHPSLGDLTFEVGFVIAAALYFVLFKALKPRLGPPAGAQPESRTLTR